MRRNRKLPNRPLAALAGAGMLLAGYLTLSAWMDTSAAYCGEGSGCDLVQGSHWSTLLGLPIAFWGFLTYAALGFIALHVRRIDAHWSFGWIVCTTGLAISLYLVGVSVFIIEATCVYCLGSLALMAASFGLIFAQKPAELPDFRWLPWLAQTGSVAVAAVFVLHLHYSGVFHPAAGPEDPYLKALAIHLENVEAKFYGASWCLHCREQKEIFGPSAHRLPYVECSPRGQNRPPARVCVTQGIRNFPTWVFGDQRYTRVIDAATLARYSGFEP